MKSFRVGVYGHNHLDLQQTRSGFLLKTKPSVADNEEDQDEEDGAAGVRGYYSSSWC